MASCIAPTTQRTKPNEEAVAIEAEKQREIAVKEASKSHYRLLRVGGPILKKSLPFCKDRKRKSIGIIYANKFNYDENFQNTKIPSYIISNMSITSKINKFFFTLSIKNIFDEKYHNYAVASSSTLGAYNAYPEPGREIIFSLGTKFNT